jgi:hypothetical protein
MVAGSRVCRSAILCGTAGSVLDFISSLAVGTAMVGWRFGKTGVATFMRFQRVHPWTLKSALSLGNGLLC